MQFFSKLLALAPLGFSLVAAVAVSSHHHYRKPSCSTKSIDQLRGQISAHLSVDATVDIVSKLCHSLTSQVTELSASADVDLSLQTVVDAEADLDLSVSVDVDVWAQIFVNLQFTLEAALKVLVDLQLQRNTCEYKQLQQHTREYVSGIFAQVYALLEIYAEVDVEIRGQLEVQLRAFVAVFNSFSKTCTSVIPGLDAEISVTVGLIVDLIAHIHIALGINLEIGGLLSIGA